MGQKRLEERFYMEQKEYSIELLLKMYEEMTRIRKFESKVVDFCFPQGMLCGNFHTCIGQEATVVGACYALEKTDYLVSTHRGHGHCIAKGVKTDKMMAELFGKATGYCGGRGGSLHVADVKLGILGANGIVGGGIPIAVGSALVTKIHRSKEVTVSFFGEGASNEGTFHEAINMAAIWKLPVVFICENNQWAAGTPVEDVINTPGIAERATGYGILGRRIDGNNVLEVLEAVKEAVLYARAGNGPSIIECKTFRMRQHNSAEAVEWRPQELMEEWAQKDPIRRLKELLLTNGISEAELLKIETKIDQEIEAAYQFAVASPYPDINDVTLNVYASDNERSVAR
jgi:TPP-dependent pyruvate/acetoin dehydrogenase alpha subunit